MPKFHVVVSKGEAHYYIAAEDEEAALDQAEEFYDRRDFKTAQVIPEPEEET